MQRRGFLSLLGGAAAAFALDPERALWVPGAKTISVPAPPAFDGFAPAFNKWGPSLVLRPGDIFTVAGIYRMFPRDSRELYKFKVPRAL